MAGRVVIPIQNERGDMIAYAGRSIEGTEPKYKLRVAELASGNPTKRRRRKLALYFSDANGQARMIQVCRFLLFIVRRGGQAR